MTTSIIETVANGVATLTLNRPDVCNAFAIELIEQLRTAIAGAAEDDAVRCILVAGAGGNFCAGGDLKAFARTLDGPSHATVHLPGLELAMEAIGRLAAAPKPTLASISGTTAGSGLALALACDLRICADDARFTTGFARVGLAADCGASYFLTRAVGLAKALELSYSAESFGADQALAWGLVNRVVPATALEAASGAWSRELAQGPTQAFGCMKAAFAAALSQPLEAVMRLEARDLSLMMAGADHRAALEAFAARSRPVFVGR